MKIRTFSGFVAVCAVVVALIAGGCSTPKNISYFEDFQTTTEIQAQAQQLIKVQPGDKLQIIVSSKDPQLAALFNLPAVTTRLGQSSQIVNGVTTSYSNSNTNEGLADYTVSPDGTIDFPILGELQVAGMTRSELAGFIKGELMGRNLIKDPRVTIEFIDTGISVLGEVSKPGRYLMNRDEVTVLDAIAMAGDLGIQGRRENIRVIRREGETTKVYIVDITNGKDLFSNPAFYLRQGDVVYIEPNDIRKRETVVNGNTVLSASFWMSVVSVLTSVAVLVVNIAR